MVMGGFQSVAPLKAFDVEMLAEGLLRPALSTSQLKEPVPVLKEMLEAESATEMKSLRGADDQMTVASFKEFPISILWEPSQLKDCPNLSSSVNTMEFMFNLQQAVKSILEEREMEDKESICWQLSLQHLWLQVNRFAQSFNWRPPPKDEEDVNVHCINLMKVLAHLPEE